MGRSSEAGIALASAPSLSYGKALAHGGKIVQLIARFRVIDNRADRNRQLDGVPVAPGALTALSMTAPLGRMFGIEAEMQQGVVVFARDQRNVSASAAVAAAWTAPWNEFLAAKRQAAIAAVTGLYGNNDFVDKHGTTLHGGITKK